MKARSAMCAVLGTGGYQPAANDDRFFAVIPVTKTEAAWKDPTQLRLVYPADIGEVLNSVEDLWLRLARHPAVHVAVSRDVSTGQHLVMFRFDRNGQCHGHDIDGEYCQLLLAAASGESYCWSQDGSRGNLASDIQWLGNTLVIALASRHQMRRWPDGEALEWSLQALLQRVKTQGGRP
jgi:hypothetical protein